MTILFSNLIVKDINVVRAQELATATPSAPAAGTGIQPLAVDERSFYYYAGEKRIHLTPSLKWISVEFASDDPAKQSTALKNFGAGVGALNRARHIPNPALTLVPLQAGLSSRTLLQGLNSLRADISGFRRADPLFQTSDAEMAITDEFIATFPAGKSRQAIDAINAAQAVELVEPILGQENTFVLRVLPAAKLDALAMANRYQEQGLAANAAPNFVRLIKPGISADPERRSVGPMAGTNDNYYSDQWALDNPGGYFGNPAGVDIDAPEAWDQTTGSPSVIIAVIDEGVDLTHEDLSAKLVTGYDATGFGSAGAPSGNDAHGTNVAGIAAAISHNTIGVAGVCRDCRIMPVRIAYGSQDGWVTYDSWIANGITWAYQNGAAILNNSWGGGSEAPVVTTAIANAKLLGRGGKGAVVVFAAGNENASAVNYPASLSTVIAVGASNMCDQRKNTGGGLCNGYETWGSNYGTALDISAPGVWLYSTDIMGAAGYDPGKYFEYMNGTSGATPIVSGVAGLVLSADPDLTADQVQAILQETADDTNGGGWDTEMGYGRVNADRAVRAVNTFFISGNVGVAGATLSYTDDTPKTATSDNNGNYSLAVSSEWDGTVTPSKTCYIFTPSDRSYTDVTASQTSQDYDYTLDPTPACPDIEASVAKISQGLYDLSPETTSKQSYSSVLNGPLRVLDTSGAPLFTSQVVTSGESYNELMGYPDNQLHTEYWFPWYDHGYPGVSGSTMRTWLAIGNPHDTLTADVDVYIGGIFKANYDIAPGGQATPRWIGLQDGPVRIVSTNGVDIFASQRVFTAPDNSFNESMGYPSDQFVTEYWFPWYDSVYMNSSLMIGNTSSSTPANVSVYIGGVFKGSYVIGINDTRIQNYPGLVNGPVRVVGTNGVNIVVSQRVRSGPKNSYNEVMGYPNNQFHTEYWFPWYDHGYSTVGGSNMRTWLAIGNPHATLTADVDVYIDGVFKANYDIPAGGQVTPRWIGLQDGPVQIISTNGVDIFASQRVFTVPNSVFNEMLGFPADQFTSQYWFPWYDTVFMNSSIFLSKP